MRVLVFLSLYVRLCANVRIEHAFSYHHHCDHFLFCSGAGDSRASMKPISVKSSPVVNPSPSARQ